MIPGILICLVTMAGLYSLARFVMQPYIERVKAEAKALKEGIIAHAVLLDIKPTGQYINDFAKVRMQMKVQPYIGRNFCCGSRRNGYALGAAPFAHRQLSESAVQPAQPERGNGR